MEQKDKPPGLPVQAGQAQASPFLTPAQLQEELQIGQNLCYRLLKEGRIPSTRVGNLYRIPRRAVEHLKEASMC